MKHFISKKVRFLTIGFLTIALIPLLSSCSKPKETSGKDRFPLLTNQAELDAASKKAGSRMVVLDFSADWCMPCKLLEPTLHELSKEFRKNAVFYRVDVDKSGELAASFGVRGIPFVVFLKEGKVVYSLTGFNPRENYAGVLTACDDTSSAEGCADRLKEKLNN